tara:strand:- start:265 stop:2979 length:2715 start_codon:yes stop_codon:yes gene_type:complete
MAVRFYGDFQNDVGDQFRVNIYDTQFSLAASELTLSVPGFALTYEGNNQEQYQPLIPSKLEFTLYNKGGDFDTWLNTVVPAATEAQFLVEVLSDPGEVDEAVWWRGVLLPEQVQQNDEPTPTAVSFVASDDLAQLKESTWDDLNLSAYTIADAIHAMLSLVRCKSLYSDNDLFLRYMNDIVPEDYTGSNYLNSGSMIAPTIPGEDPVAFYNCYDILRSIAITFNARVFQAQGVWYFMPLNKLQQRSDGDTFTGDLYAMEADGDDATWTTLEKVGFVSNMLKINGTGIEKMAGNIIEYSRPTKRVDRIRITKANEYLFQENTGLTTLSGTTSDIEFSDDDRTYFAGSTHLMTVNYHLEIASVASENNFVNLHTVRCDLTIKFGDQYYTNDGWSGTAGVKSTVIGTYYKNFGFEEISQFSVQVPELVDNEVGLDVTLNTVVVNGAGVDITGSLPTHFAQHLLRIYAGDSANNLGDSVTFSSQTTIDNQVTLTQSDVVTGTVAVSYGVGLSDVQYGSGSYFLGGVDHETWTSSQTSTGYSLNRLGVREIMYNTQLPHRIRNGAFYIDTSASWLWPYHLLRENSADHGIHQLTYTANASEVTMERWQLNQDTTNLEFRTDQVGTDNPRDRFAPSGSNTAARLSTDINDQATGSRAQFRNVIDIDGSVGSTHTIDVNCDDGFLYTLEWVDTATGFSSIVLPKVLDNEGRLLRFKTDDTIRANRYFKIEPTAGDYTDGTRIDGADSFSLDRDYDGIMVLCHDRQWFVIQRKGKDTGGGGGAQTVQFSGGYSTTSTLNFWIPWSGSTSEGTSLETWRQVVIAQAGTVKSIHFHYKNEDEDDFTGTMTLRLYDVSSGVSLLQTKTKTGIDHNEQFSFTFDQAVSAQDLFAVRIQFSSNPLVDLTYTLIAEYD